MSNSNRFKDIGTFLSKKLLMRSHMTRNALDDPKSVQCSAHNFTEFFWFKLEASIFKNG